MNGSCKENKENGEIHFSKAADILEASLVANVGNSRKPLCSVISSDLVSDILMYVEADPLLLTGLVNPQVIRVADMIGIGGIIFVAGKEPEGDVVDLAEEKSVPVATTESTLYEASGRLYVAGLKPCEYGDDCQ